MVLGRSNLAESAQYVEVAARLLAESLPGARFLPALRRANVFGALDMGLAPGLLPGRVGLADRGPHLMAHWGAIPEERGRDTTAMLEAAASGELGMLVLIGADPISDFPDADLARRALRTVPFVVSLGTHEDRSNELADVVLPIAGADEHAGTTTNLEGRVSLLGQKVVAPGLARPAWVVAVEIAGRLGTGLGFESVEEIFQEIERVAPSHRGLRLSHLASPAGRDGVVVPLPSSAASIAGASTRPLPRLIDPIATPGIASVEEQGAPLQAGASEPPGADPPADRGVGGARAQLDAQPLVGPSMPDGDEAFAGSGHPGGARAGAPLVLRAPRADGYGLRLVVTRELYDAGTLLQAAPSLAPLANPGSLRVHPGEVERLGVSAGSIVRLTAPRGTLEIPISPDASVPRGIAVLGANPASSKRSGELVDSGALVNDVRLGTIEHEAEVS